MSLQAGAESLSFCILLSNMAPRGHGTLRQIGLNMGTSLMRGPVEWGTSGIVLDNLVRVVVVHSNDWPMARSGPGISSCLLDAVKVGVGLLHVGEGLDQIITLGFLSLPTSQVPQPTCFMAVGEPD